MQPGADPRRPHEHRVQPGLLLAVAAALGVLAQLALPREPRAVPAHRDGPPPLPARLCPQRHQPRALPQPARLARDVIRPQSVARVEVPPPAQAA